MKSPRSEVVLGSNQHMFDEKADQSFTISNSIVADNTRGMAISKY